MSEFLNFLLQNAFLKQIIKIQTGIKNKVPLISSTPKYKQKKHEGDKSIESNKLPITQREMTSEQITFIQRNIKVIRAKH